MSTQPGVQRDERTLAVENASYRWAYLLLTYALLLDVMFRGLFHNEAAWDLMALVVVGGIACTIYQARQKALPEGWGIKAVLLACAAALIAALVAVVVTLRG